MLPHFFNLSIEKLLNTFFISLNLLIHTVNPLALHKPDGKSDIPDILFYHLSEKLVSKTK